ncbi:hypothetical protein PIB30_095765 [Stylosanthes scabra]|uniref:Uncharacterized protein n=1 Tax=Stylosanthes scabra TaxID=79078 RepID=A0ABU6VVP7_9FABA|nr:hypothetical protein [Stylosanthes scabra]
MNMMRRLKSIASGRTSISLDPGGDSGTKRAKFDQETTGKVNDELNTIDNGSKDQEHFVDTQMGDVVGTSDVYELVPNGSVESHLHGR